MTTKHCSLGGGVTKHHWMEMQSADLGPELNLTDHQLCDLEQVTDSLSSLFHLFSNGDKEEEYKREGNKRDN